MSGRVAAIVVAAGEGRRFGGPKQFASVGGRRALDWSVDAARSVATTVVLVVPPDSVDDAALKAVADVVVAGGATRVESVRSGMAALAEDPDVQADIVVIHDAARPLATAGLFRAVVAAVADGADGAVPGLPISDTVKRVAAGRVVVTVDRSDLVAVQTPQAFRASVLRRAHLASVGAGATDDAALLEQLGAVVVVVHGEPRNIKLTSIDDLALLEALATK